MDNKEYWFIVIVLALLALWWYFLWIIAGMFVEYFKLTPYGIAMQFFVWIVINVLVGGFGKLTIGRN